MKTRELLKVKSREQRVNTRYEEEITCLRNALASGGLHQQAISGPSFNEIRATPIAVEAEEAAGGTVGEAKEEHRQEDVLFVNDQPPPEEEAREATMGEVLAATMDA